MLKQIVFLVFVAYVISVPTHAASVISSHGCQVLLGRVVMLQFYASDGDMSCEDRARSTALNLQQVRVLGGTAKDFYRRGQVGRVTVLYKNKPVYTLTDRDCDDYGEKSLETLEKKWSDKVNLLLEGRVFGGHELVAIFPSERYALRAHISPNSACIGRVWSGKRLRVENMNTGWSKVVRVVSTCNANLGAAIVVSDDVAENIGLKLAFPAKVRVEEVE